MQEGGVLIDAYRWFFADEEAGLSAAQGLLTVPWGRQNAINNNASGENITFNNKNSRSSIHKYETCNSEDLQNT